MDDLHSLETSALIDLLVMQMEEFSRMLNEGSSEEEFARCGDAIKAIQAEIESRQPNASIHDAHTTVSKNDR